MSTLPLARTIVAKALQHKKDLLIYVEGLTSGFDGKILVELSPLKIFPPQFDIYEIPGNMGINPAAAPRDVPTSAAYAFSNSGDLRRIWIQDAKERQEINVVQVSNASAQE